MSTKKTVNDNQLYTTSIVPIFLESTTDRFKVYSNATPGGAKELRPLSKANMKDDEPAVVASMIRASEEAAELAATPQVIILLLTPHPHPNPHSPPIAPHPQPHPQPHLSPLTFIPHPSPSPLVSQVVRVGTKTVTVHHQIQPSMHDGKNLQV